jgi:hypothetical protein
MSERRGGFPGVVYERKAEPVKIEPKPEPKPEPKVEVAPAEDREDALKKLVELGEDLGLYEEELVDAPKVEIEEAEVRSKKKKKFVKEEE